MNLVTSWMGFCGGPLILRPRFSILGFQIAVNGPSGGVLWGSHALLGLLTCKRKKLVERRDGKVLVGDFEWRSSIFKTIKHSINLEIIASRRQITMFDQLSERSGKVGWQKQEISLLYCWWKKNHLKNDVCFFQRPFGLPTLKLMFTHFSSWTSEGIAPPQLARLPSMPAQLMLWVSCCLFWICPISVGRRNRFTQPEHKTWNWWSYGNNKFHYL